MHGPFTSVVGDMCEIYNGTVTVDLGRSTIGDFNPKKIFARCDIPFLTIVEFGDLGNPQNAANWTAFQAYLERWKGEKAARQGKQLGRLAVEVPFSADSITSMNPKAKLPEVWVKPSPNATPAMPAVILDIKRADLPAAARAMAVCCDPFVTAADNAVARAMGVPGLDVLDQVWAEAMATDSRVAAGKLVLATLEQQNF